MPLSKPKIPEQKYDLKAGEVIDKDDKMLYLGILEPVITETLSREEYEDIKTRSNKQMATSLAFTLKRNQRMDMFDDIYPYAEIIYEKIKETDGKVNNYRLMKAIINNLDEELNDKFLDDVLNSYRNFKGLY